MFLTMVLLPLMTLLSPSERVCLDSSDVNNMTAWQLDCERVTCQSEYTDRRPVARSRWEQFRESNCFCDNLCEVYSDCCADKHERAFNADHVLPRDSFACLVVDGLYSTGLPIYVVNSCPADWNDDIIRKHCQKEVDSGSGLFLNWFVSDENFVLFRNYYCALCHGRTSVTYWRIRVACDEVVRLESEHSLNDQKSVFSKDYVIKLLDKLEAGVCHLKYEPPDHVNRSRFVRLCKPMIDTCPEKWTDDCVRDKCQGQTSEASFVYSPLELMTYRNKYCALCNWATDDVTCDDVVIGSTFQPMVGLMRDTSFYPLNIIFDLNPGGRPVAEYKIGTESGTLINKTVTKLASCPEQHVYDPFIAACRRVTCRSGHVFRSGTCQQLTSLNTTTDFCVAMVTLNQSEYVLFKNGSILLNRSGTLYDQTEYEITTDGSVAVCSNFTRNFTEFSDRIVMMKFSKEQGIVSVIGQFISILALTMTLIIYSWLPKLRNLAGKCVISLSASLLTAQFLFLVGVSFHAIDSGSWSGVCVVFAVATHLAFLCSFTWMNVMAYDICRIFTRSVHKASSESNRKRFYRYSTYAWFSPCVVVAMAMVTDFVSSPTSSLRPGYGDGLCWITNRMALFVFFALPVALILMANVVMFILTSLHISRVQKDTKKTTGCVDKHRYGVYIKISVIMGLTWIFAFVAAATDSEVLWYFFLVFNTLQGAFIFVAFAFTKQVMTMLRDKYHKIRRSIRHPSDKSTEERTLTTMTSHSVSSSANNVLVHKK